MYLAEITSPRLLVKVSSRRSIKDRRRCMPPHARGWVAAVALRLAASENAEHERCGRPAGSLAHSPKLVPRADEQPAGVKSAVRRSLRPASNPVAHFQTCRTRIGTPVDSFRGCQLSADSSRTCSRGIYTMS